MDLPNRFLTYTAVVLRGLRIEALQTGPVAPCGVRATVRYTAYLNRGESIPDQHGRHVRGWRAQHHRRTLTGVEGMRVVGGGGSAWVRTWHTGTNGVQALIPAEREAGVRG